MSYPGPHQEMTEAGLTRLVFWQAQITRRGSSEWERRSRPQPQRAVQQGTEAGTAPGRCCLSVPREWERCPPCPSAPLREGCQLRQDVQRIPTMTGPQERDPGRVKMEASEQGWMVQQGQHPEARKWC